MFGKNIVEDISNITEGKVGKEQRKVFCCKQTLFYKPIITDHESLFKSFLKFDNDHEPPQFANDDQHALQIVKQKNFGPIEEKRYFCLPDFHEVSEGDFNKMGYQRLNSFKNIKCNTHNYFFEMNAYKKGDAYSHHHKSTVGGCAYTRDSSEIDLASGSDKGFWNRR